MPRVCYVGNVGPGSADHSTENDIRRAFEYLGWTVDPVREIDFMRQIQRPRDWEALRERFLASDLVLHTLTQGQYPAVDQVLGLWQACANAGVPTASVHLDLFYGLSSPKDAGPQRQDLPRLHPMFRVAHVFTADGDHDAEFERDGVNHHWLPPAVRHDEARRIEPTAEDRVKYAGIDVAFIGSKGYHKEWPHRPEMIDRLRDQYGSRFAHIGGGADADLHGDDGGALRGEALNRAYATIPVIVGDYCFAGQLDRYWSDRFFETWGRGGNLVFPHSQALADLVPGIWSSSRGRGYPSWIIGDWDELFREVDGAIRNYDHPTCVRLCGEMQAWVAREHTYVNRVRTMLDVIGLPYGAQLLVEAEISAARLATRRALIEAAERLEGAAAELRLQAEKVA